MLSHTVRILNFDDSLLKQKNLLRKFHPTIVNLKPIGPEARIWLNRRTAEEIRSHLKPEFKNSITFLGSGDFHQVTNLLIGQFTEPLTVIVFDHHPDWDILPPRLHCGSWVTEVLRRENIRKLILLGVSSNDLSTGSIHTGNLGSLKGDRVEIYPYSHTPTRVFFRHVPRSKSIQVEKGIFSSRIYWKQLKSQNLTDFFFQMMCGLETKRAYVSIDKDCLRANYSLTNWEEGYFELDELLTLLKLIQANLDVAGLDIVGDYSPCHVEGPLKRFLEAWDRPRNFTGKGQVENQISQVNEETNMRILEGLTEGYQDNSRHD